MTADEFARLGLRLFGYGWQSQCVQLLGRSRPQIVRYATGVEPIPPGMALLLRLCAARLNEGKPFAMPDAIGTIEAAPRP